MFAIQFKSESRTRYAIGTKGDPLYNAIDSGTLAGAKTWKTEKGAKKYLESHVLADSEGARLREKWESIEVVEIPEFNPLKEAQARYQQTEKGKERQKRYREKAETREKRREYDKKRERAEYMKKYRQRKKTQ